MYNGTLIDIDGNIIGSVDGNIIGYDPYKYDSKPSLYATLTMINGNKTSIIGNLNLNDIPPPALKLL